MNFKSIQLLFLILLTALCANVAHAQIPVDEAQRRLQEKLATRPTTQPAPNTEVEKLRAENLRLRERVMNLEEEVTTLKGVIARSTPATSGPTTRPAEVVAVDNPAQKTLLAHWRGGDITAGSGYLLTFNPDGTYEQLFTASGKRDTGQYRVADDNTNTLEMWDNKWPDTKKHNQYHFAATALRLTLTPVYVDGIEVKTPRPLVLAKAE